jgi:hypothetical protein
MGSVSLVYQESEGYENANYKQYGVASFILKQLLE